MKLSDFDFFERQIDTIISEIDQIAPVAASDLGKLPGWSWVTDEYGDYVHCSPEVIDILGISAEKFIGKSLFSFQLTRHSYRKLNLLLRSEKYEGELAVLFKSSTGVQQPIRMYVSQKKNRKGNNAGWYGFCHVISDAEDAKKVSQNLSHIRTSGNQKPSHQLSSSDPISPLSQVLENARVFKNIMDRSRDLALINRVVSRLATSSLDLTECLHLVKCELGNIFNIDQGISLLLDPIEDKFITVGGYFKDRDENDLMGSEFAINPIIELVMTSYVSIVVDAEQGDQQGDIFFMTMLQQGVKKRAIFPVTLNQELCALIFLDLFSADQDFQEKDIRLGEAILQQFSIIFQENPGTQ